MAEGIQIIADGNSANKQWLGGMGSFVVQGEFDGATIKLQYSPDQGQTWIDATPEGSLNFTSDNGGLFYGSAGWLLRVNTAGGGILLTAVAYIEPAERI